MKKDYSLNVNSLTFLLSFVIEIALLVHKNLYDKRLIKLFFFSNRAIFQPISKIGYYFQGYGSKCITEKGQ